MVPQNGGRGRNGREERETERIWYFVKNQDVLWVAQLLDSQLNTSIRQRCCYYRCVYQLDKYSSGICRVRHTLLGSCPEHLKSCAIKHISLILIPISVAVPGVNLHLCVKVFALFDLHMEEEHAKEAGKKKHTLRLTKFPTHLFIMLKILEILHLYDCN